jgi:hypothetical protein
MSKLSHLIMILKDISPWLWALLPSEDVLLITRLGCRCILNIICFSLSFHIIFICAKLICPDIVLYSTVFSSFNPADMPFGPTILIS